MSNFTSASFATYNILHPYYAVQWAESAGLNEKGKTMLPEQLRELTKSQDANAYRLCSNWDERCPKIVRNIQKADVVCLQEVSRETLDNIQHSTSYRLANSAYHSSRQSVGEFGNAILYRADKAHLEDVFEIVHRYETSNGSASRSAAGAIFTIEGKIIKVASVHLSGYWSKEPDFEKKQKSKESGFKECQTYAEGLESHLENIDGIVIGGDFNEDQSEANFDLYRLDYLKEKGYQFDDSLAVTEPLKGRRIDWLGYKSLESRQIKLTAMQLESIQEPASDHLMTGTIVNW